MKEPEYGAGGAVQPVTSSVRPADARAPILVAVDFSTDSEHALVWAFDHARKLDRPIEVLHVVHDPANAPGIYRSENGDPLEPMSDVAERKLSEYLDDVTLRHPEIPVPHDMTTLCRPGLPVQTILSTAAERGACLLVVGSRGLSGAARLLLGSTSQSVAKRAGMPVTIVKANG